MGDDPGQAGTVLAGKYTVLREIGRGGMATVYLADDLRHGRQVAVKIMHPVLSDSAAATRFLREIGIVAQLQHPNVVPLYDSGEANGELFYVMPFVEGETLSRRIERTGPLPIRDALRIARDIAAALEYAHRRDVIHRDIKPSNVLITAEMAVVADFGIARALGQASAVTLTATGVVGTPTYMSPEHADGTTAVGAPSDVYALGCVLYEMLTGTPPYIAMSFSELLVKHVAAPVPEVRAVRADVPEHVEAILHNALAKRPADRAPAAELRAALDEALAASVVSRTAQGSSLRRVRAALPAHRRRRIAIASAATAVLVAGALTLWRPWARIVAGGALDANLIAVAPFDIAGSGLEVWRDGMVDVLSRNFDGAGPLRAVPPTTIIRNWNGRADEPSGKALAGRTRAGLIVLGAITRRTRDTVAVSARLLDATGDSSFAEEIVQGPEENVGAICDSISILLLQQLGHTRPIAAVPGTTIGAKSVSALKAFLEGEQAYRKNDTATARVAYLRAIGLDSNFTLAFRRMRSVTRFDEWDSTSMSWALKAGAMNRSLSRRDSLLVLADSLAPLTNPNQPEGFTAASFQYLTRRLAVLTEAARLYPDDPEVWNDLGELRLHGGYRVPGNSRSLMREAFDRAISLDTAFASAYYHAIELSLSFDDPEAARRLALANLVVDRNASDRWVLARLLQRRPAERELRALTDTMDPVRIRSVGYLMRLAYDADEGAARVFRMLQEREDSLGVSGAQTRGLLRLTLLRRGRLRESRDLNRPNETGGEGALQEMGLIGAMPADTALHMFTAWARTGSVDRAIMSLPWWSARRETSVIQTIAMRCDSVTAAGVAGSALSLAAESCHDAAEAHLALASGDSALAARLFVAQGDSLCGRPCAYNRLIGARVLLSRGDPAAAAALLDRWEPLVSNGTLYEGWWHLERARIAARLGDGARAQQQLALANALWVNADPVLRQAVDDARAAVSRGIRNQE